MLDTLVQLSLGAFIFLVVAYFVYMAGLSVVLRQLRAPAWRAFIPGYNIMAQIEAVGLPRNWFVKAIVPYVGALYALAIAVRLGRVYGRKPMFSSVWLTFGAPVGMWVIALGSHRPDMQVVASPPPHIDKAKFEARMGKLKRLIGKPAGTHQK